MANAGTDLSGHPGLPQPIRKHLDLSDALGRANTADKLMKLVASALTDGDCIDDASVLRTDGTACAPGCVVRAPSALGTFLPSFWQTAPLSHGRPLLMAVRGVSLTSVISCLEARKQPVFKAASSPASGVVSHPAARRACSRSKAERME